MTDKEVVMHFSTDPATTVTLNYDTLIVTILMPSYGSKYPSYERRSMIIEDLDPAKWMRRAKIVNAERRRFIHDTEAKLEIFLSTLKYT